jgi:hypothetical protein
MRAHQRVSERAVAAAWACELAPSPPRKVRRSTIRSRALQSISPVSHFLKKKIIVAQLHLHGHDFFLLHTRRRVVAVNESERAVLYSLYFFCVSFGLGMPSSGGAVK